MGAKFVVSDLGATSDRHFFGLSFDPMAKVANSQTSAPGHSEVVQDLSHCNLTRTCTCEHSVASKCFVFVKKAQESARAGTFLCRFWMLLVHSMHRMHGMHRLHSVCLE